MKLEQVFFIYRKLAKKSIDLCERVEIVRDYSVDLEMNPLAVRVKFIPKYKRELNQNEKQELKTFCDHHGFDYEINEKGDMIWYYRSITNRGNQKTGQM